MLPPRYLTHRQAKLAFLGQNLFTYAHSKWCFSLKQYHALQAGLKLTIKPVMALNSQYPHFHLPSASNRGVSHCALQFHAGVGIKFCVC